MKGGVYRMLTFMTGARLLFCTSQRNGGPLFRILFESDGFTVSGRAAAKDDAPGIPIHPCICVSGVGPDFTGQVQPKAGFKNAPLGNGQPDSLHADLGDGIIQYPSCRAVSADIVGGVQQSLQLLPGLTGLIPFVRSCFRYVPERFQTPVVTFQGFQSVGDISVTMADRATGIVAETAEILRCRSHPVPVTDIQPEILRLSHVGICRKGDFLRIDRREIRKYTFRLIDAYRSQVE